MMDKPCVAAFDFDGTITTRDAFMPFALFVAGPKKWLANLARLIPAATLFLVGKISRQDLKEKTITLFFKGFAYKDLLGYAEEFAAEVLPRLVKKKALDTLKWHQEQGHRIVIISASPEIYLIPWGKKIGAHDILASKLEVGREGEITGKLSGPNCRGLEKVKRLKELLGSEKTYELFAYGDSRGDKELLAFADHSYFRKI